jgi:hypothetical protein
MDDASRTARHPETLAAPGPPEADPITGGLAPVISMSTNYEQRPDGGYPQGRVYTRADNPTSRRNDDPHTRAPVATRQLRILID